MRLNSTRLAAPMTLLSLAAAVACRDSTRDVTANDALRRDLELAQASTTSLASTSRDLPATRFVSALEAGERPSTGVGAAARPARRSATKAPRARARHAPPAQAAVGTVAESSETPAEATTIAEAPAPAPTTGDGGPSAPERPAHSGGGEGVISVSPTDAPGSGDGNVTVERRRGRGIGGIFGGIIGVVIRGGSVGDDDHCERDHPGRRGVPIGGGAAGRMPIPFPGSGGLGLPRSGIGRVIRPNF